MQGCSASQHQELTIVLFGYRAYRVEDIREEWTEDVGDLFLHHLSELHRRFARFAARVDLREIEDVLPPSYLETAGFIDLLAARRVPCEDIQPNVLIAPVCASSSPSLTVDWAEARLLDSNRNVATPAATVPRAFRASTRELRPICC